MTDNKAVARELIGNDIILSVDTESIAVMEKVRDAVKQLWPEKKFILVQKDRLKQLTDKEMNDLGWYRKGGADE